MNECVIATGNAAKLRELQSLLQPFGLVPVAQSVFGIEPPDEPFAGFVENALVKARHASRIAQRPAIADDSGICVPALAGEPGVHSARYAQRHNAGSGDAANNQLLVQRVRALAPQDNATQRAATYVCVLVWIEHADDPLPLIAQGLWHGQVVDEARGSAGFGYDAHFLLPDKGLTVAELSAPEKNAISHRAIAMRGLAAALHARQ